MNWKWNNQKGMTIVEMIVAFSILMIALAMFGICLNASFRVRFRMQSAKTQIQEFLRDYYLEEIRELEPEKMEEIVLEFEERDGDGRFTIPAVRRMFRLETGVFYDVTAGEAVRSDGQQNAEEYAE